MSALRVLRALFRVSSAVAPRLSARLAAWLWFRTARPREKEPGGSLLDRAESHRIEGDGWSAIVYSWGSGPAVLLVHGWQSRASRITRFVEPLIQRGYRVVTLDQPAHGRAPGNRTNIFEIREALLRVAEEHGPFEGVIAHSLGSLAYLTARAHGLHAGRAVCISPGIDLDTLVGTFAQRLDLSDEAAAGLKERIEDFVGPDFYPEIEAADGGTPTLVIHGRADTEVPWPRGEALAESLSEARFELIDGLGHRDVLRDPTVIEMTAQFLTSDH